MPVTAQYFLRGEIKDVQGKPLLFANIRLFSKGTVQYTSGASGTFGIPLSKKEDTITVSLEGYETLVKPVSPFSFQSLTVKQAERMAAAEMGRSGGLNSVTKSIAGNSNSSIASYGGETYISLAENDFENAEDVSETSLSLNINSASYSNIRRFLNGGSKVPPDGVRIEEMLNYFNLNKLSSNNGASDQFQITSKLTSCPWNLDHQLFFVNVCSPKINPVNVPAAKFIFLIDVSGSMDKDNRLPLVQAAFKMLVNHLRREDTIGIVTYGGYVGVALPPTSGADKQKIDSVIDGLRADGDTPGSQAIQTAYNLSEKIYDAKSNNRVILATDGDFNIGQTSDKELENIVSAHKEKGIYLTCLGTGMGNYKDSRLETLAKKANGNFAYIDNMQEAQKTMAAEFFKNMYAVADNAVLQVHFNAALVKKFRLIGYDNRKDALFDARLNDGGELGNGQNTMAVFEIKQNAMPGDAIADVALQYHNPGSNKQELLTTHASVRCIPVDSADANLRVATALCIFGSMLKQSKYAVTDGWQLAERLAAGACDGKDVLQKELVKLIAKAREIYTVLPNDGKRKKEVH